ncbi:hypothetical protein NRB_47990 [Novosphingobium sp. 11B]
MFLRAFGERDEADLHQILQFDPRTPGAVNVPSLPLDHRQEAADHEALSRTWDDLFATTAAGASPGAHTR